MESYYSVIYIKTNPLLEEQVAVAILFSGGDGPWLHLSQNRLKLIESVLHRNTFLSLRRNLVAFKEKVDHYRESKPDLLLFDPHYSKEQLNEMVAKHKGTILFTEPTVINDWMDEQLKNKLVATVFGEKIKTKAKRKPPFSLIWKAYINGKKFNHYLKDTPLSDLNTASLSSIAIHLLDEQKKHIIQGLSFDLKKETVQMKLRELAIISNDCMDYKLDLVYPTPKTTQGKTYLEESKKQLQNVNFIPFTEFKK